MSKSAKSSPRPSVAQSGSATRLGRVGRRFESCRSDQPPVTPELVERFWLKIRKGGADECWPWTGAKSRGYGSFRIPRRSSIQATRYAYLLATKRWPGRYLVCHACDNPACCNPAHLWLGLPADNSRDMVMKGRQRSPDQRGENNPRAKLTDDRVREIRRLIADGLTNVTIAPLFGVSHATISLIRLGRFWKHVA